MSGTMFDPKHDPVPVTGYRKLSDFEVAMMNEIKNEGIQLGALIERISRIESIDQRWVAIAKTDLQKGIMALVRAVAKPETF